MAESRATFTVRGVESDDQARELEARIGELEGVMGATVEGASGSASVRYDEELLAEERVREAVREAGYELA